MSARVPATAERIYALLLRAYPSAFLADYERDMRQLFRDEWRARGGNGVEFWSGMLWDVARSAPGLRVEAWRARALEDTRTEEATMKIISTVTALFGLFAIVAGVWEGMAASRQGTLDTPYLLAVMLAAVAGALLVGAAWSGLRASPRGRRGASRLAIASLVVFLVARLTMGWMSIFLQLAGVVLPIVVLAALHRRGASPKMA